MPSGGDPKCLIFGSFDQAKERTKKNNAVRLKIQKILIGLWPFAFSFSLMKKKQKIKNG